MVIRALSFFALILCMLWFSWKLFVVCTFLYMIYVPDPYELISIFALIDALYGATDYTALSIGIAGIFHAPVLFTGVGLLALFVVHHVKRNMFISDRMITGKHHIDFHW